MAGTTNVRLRSKTMRRKRTDERCDNGPKIVICPAESHDDEELPLIPSHSNFLDLRNVSSISCKNCTFENETYGMIQDSSFRLVDWIERALFKDSSIVDNA